MIRADDKDAGAKGTDDFETTLRVEQVNAIIPATLARDSAGGALGRTIKERFVLESQLGDGGMGVVYKARDLRREEKADPNVYVALKLIGDAIQSHPEAPLALQREASRALRLAHPNIVHMYDFDRDGDLSYLTMELLSGTSFDALLRKHGSGIAFDAAASLIRQLCSGLAYAHAQGIIHSDLKPSNVFLTHDGVVKILDFGIATPLRGLNDDRPETSFNPRRMGALSPTHACVEMWYGMDADPRDDIYSLGCIVYELYCGRHPFGGTNAPKAMETDMEVAPIPELSRRQNRALRAALSFRREDRTPTVQQFVEEFGLESAGVRRNRWLPASIVALGIAVLAIAGVRYAIRDQGQDVLPQTRIPASGGPKMSTNAPDAARDTTQAAVERTEQTASDAQKPSSPRTDTFEIRCQGTPGRELLDRLVDEGLAEQTNLTLGAGDDRKQAAANFRRIVTCLRELQDRGFTDQASRALVRDAEALPDPL